MNEITFGKRKILFDLQHKERKSLTIKVYPDTSVSVLAPLESKREKIFEKLRLKAPWILKQIDKFNSYKPGTPPRRFINGETHLYLGRQYRLKIVPDKVPAVKAYRGELIIHSACKNAETLKAQLDQWYKTRAEFVFNELLDEVLPKFKRYNIEIRGVSIRSMSKRWGSCTPTGKIILNNELIKAPKGCIEYVIVHELCHLVHYNHTKQFQNLQSRMLQDWRKLKERLETLLG
jgi:predicted metal-dependent hydrolase